MENSWHGEEFRTLVHPVLVRIKDKVWLKGGLEQKNWIVDDFWVGTLLNCRSFPYITLDCNFNTWQDSIIKWSQTIYRP